jgi:hypothetical protein
MDQVLSINQSFPTITIFSEPMLNNIGRMFSSVMKIYQLVFEKEWVNDQNLNQLANLKGCLPYY